MLGLAHKDQGVERREGTSHCRLPSPGALLGVVPIDGYQGGGECVGLGRVAEIGSHVAHQDDVGACLLLSVILFV